MDKNYWNQRYRDGQTGWDIGQVSQPLKEYIDQIEDKEISILIPGCGNAHEAIYLWDQGFKNVFTLDVSELALQNFHKKCPDFPVKNLICEDFFEFDGQFDLILEQTFFCALLPELRAKYVVKMKSLLKKEGKLVGLLFNTEFDGGPPFGGCEEEYRELFSQYFELITMTEAHNSIEPRSGRELFFIAKVKH
ncbi:MAG: methyltransferase domain-containing protein [Crocinitomicaceae bacterium]|nr:methyltransferase domain-containing protein [Crocinitomicaceae bacterium]